MKTASAIGLILAAFSLSGIAAENSAIPATGVAPANNTGSAAMRRAAESKQYLFAFFYEKDDETTRAARKTFDTTIQKVAATSLTVAVDRSAPAEKDMVQKFGVDRAPMPLILAIAPNGAVTGGFKAADASEERLRDAVVSPGMQQCLKALQERRLVLLCLQNGTTTDNDAAMKGVNEFKADARFAEATEIVKLDPSDTKESKLLAQVKADPKAKVASTAFLAPPGVVVAKIDGPTSKDSLVASLTKAMASCGPSGCGPSGCGPAPAK